MVLAGVHSMWQSPPSNTSPPRPVCASSATRFDMVPLVTNSAASLPVIAAAIELQTRLRDRNRRREVDVGLRIGVSTGDVTITEDDYLGTPPPAGVDEAGFIEWLDGMQDEWVHAARRLSPALVLQLLGWSGPQLIESFRTSDPRARTAHVSWAGPEPVPVWLVSACR